MGKSQKVVIKRERADKSPETERRRDKRIERKLIQLGKDHPENTYEIQETTNKKNCKIIQIKRIAGIRPHKVKGNKNATIDSKILGVK